MSLIISIYNIEIILFLSYFNYFYITLIENSIIRVALDGIIDVMNI